MNYTDVIAGQAEWAAKNMAYNLDFIPADKLEWKPAPTANSALEIVSHAVHVLKRIGASISGASSQPEFIPVTDLENAKSLLIAAAQEYCEVLRTVKPEDLNKKMDMPFGSVTLARMVSIPMIDLIHHHGQIAYIQTLLGDTEPHFDMSAI